MKVSEYFSEFSVRVDKSSIKKVDATLDRLEGRLNGIGKGGGFRLGRFNINQSKLDADLEKALSKAGLKAVFNITKFDVNQAALNVALGAALDLASARNTFHISRFNIDQSHLNAQLIAAMTAAARVASVVPIRPRIAPQSVISERPAARSVARAAGVGGIGAGLSRLYAPALGLALGGYGLSQLNQRNQQVVSAQLQSQSVVQQAGGGAEEGTNSFQYLRKEANRIGFNYLDASGDYNKLISGLTGSGVSVKESQKVFTGFAELARVNKLDKTTQNRLYRALSQVAGKGKLQSEELVGQISEALPGGTALFAQAYQAQLKAKGGKGDLTGQAAIQAILADMKKGKVTSEILTYAGAAASQRANQGGALEKASTASQAEQQRYQNSVSDLAVVASNAGVEEGFARIFRTLNAGLSESGDLVKTLAEGFNDATKWGDDLLLWPQSFIRALEGKDSLVADWLGADKTKELIQDWTNIKNIWTQLTSGPTPTWLPTLEATSKELAAVLREGAEFAQWLKTLRDSSNKQSPDASFARQPITATWQLGARIINGVSAGLDAAKTKGQAVYDDPTSPYYHQPDKYDADMAKGTNPYQNLSSQATDGIDSEDQFAKDLAQAKFEDNYRNSPLKVGLPALQNPLTGLFNNYNPDNYSLPKVNLSSVFPLTSLATLPSADETTPNGEPFQDLSQYGPKSPEEIADWNKSAAMAAADQAVTNNNSQSNQFDIQISIDGATLMGMDVAGQGQALADAFTAQVTAAFEHAQTNFPIRE